MSINVNYYGSESTWLNIPMYADMPDTFMLGQYSNVSQSSGGLISRTWLATKYGMNYDTYKQPLDKSYGYCITDGNAPFDNVMFCTGYNSNYPNRIKTHNKGKSTVGFAGYGNASAYLNNPNVQYYKISSSDTTTFNNVPLNFNPPYPFTPHIYEYSNGFKYMDVCHGFISPALKYDFGYYYIVPFIHYFVLKDEYTIADVDSVTDPNNYSGMFKGAYNSDLRRFHNDVANNVISADKIVINLICVKLFHISWREDGTYTATDVSTGEPISETTCRPIPFFHSDKTTELTFTNWYKTTEAESYTVNIDTSFVSQQFVNLGTDVHCYNGLTNVNTLGTVRTATVIAGQRYVGNTPYDPLNLSTAPYTLTPCAYGDDNFTVKWFESSDIPDTRKHAVSVYATLDSFGGLDNFREYVRKSIAFFGCYFSECLYPNATKEWNTTDCFIGTIDDNGITHGNYTNGTDNDNQRQKTWGDEWSEKTPYDPNKPPPTDENDKGDLTSHLNSGSYVTSAKYYATTEQQITRLIDFMNTYAPTDTELTADFKGVNPSDYITTILYFPFDVMYSGAASQIFLSVLNTTATGLKFNPSYGITVADFGGISIERYFNDFRDFSPYTKLSLNIPFATTVELDIGEYYGHTLNIKSAIDFTTGDILTLIMRDSLVTKTVSGNCAVQLPVSALAMGTYQQTLNTLQSNAKINEAQSMSNDVLTLTNTGVSVVGAAMSSGATALLSNPINTLVSGTTQRDVLSEQAGQIDYTLKHTTPTPISLSGGTPCNMAMLEYLPRYTITRCKSLNMINYDVFGKTVGYATVEQGRISDFSGYIVCSDIEFDGISATESEQNLIKNILKSGVVI